MNIAYASLFAAALIAMILTISAVFFLGKRGPWGSLWTFFIVLFLTLWTVSIYVAPIGPLYWGIAWVPLMIAGLIITVLLIAAMPHPPDPKMGSYKNTDDAATTHDWPSRPVGRFFWILIVLFTMAIIIGALNPQKAL